jgi:uncharacterized protein (TIGR03086 family)
VTPWEHPRPAFVPALIEALEVQVTVGRQVSPHHLSLATPCPGWSVRDVMSHSIGVTLKFVDFAAGRTDHPHAQAADPIGADHRDALRSAATASQMAWKQADMSRHCHLAFGTFPADHAAGINLFDVVAHTWDIASATGVSMSCPDEIWQIALDAAVDVVSPARDPSHYGPEVPSPFAASAKVQLLNFLGRRDAWRP